MATAYLGSYLVVGTVLFGISLTALALGGSLSIIWLGLPFLVGAAGIIRGCAQFERLRALLVGIRILPAYRQVIRPGLLAQLRTRWSDPATLRDCVYLLVLFIPLLIIDTVGLAVWLGFVAMIALPLWYWSIPQTWEDTGVHDHGVIIGYLPNGPHMSDGGCGVWIGSFPAALMASAVFFVLACLAAYLVVGVARAHAGAAHNLLGLYLDPLTAARQVLDEAGPLRR
ncbi:sensor domain-containing protein [Frankia sp. R82]|uniref:sensor domain-containing protein n=1 Tax=Frankia sp. R82 TaxID=2950553 RepID=UPI002043F69F|nr:sensor domain-containing protein [Frankia sp. R82]MCM3884200.1 sensor domain-containing protein [Frankia sp. R82]